MSNSVKVTIYIVRHGECLGNSLQKALEPATDFLTDVGKEQAQLLGETLKNIPFTRVYASDFPRTLQTAEIIVNKINQCSSKKLEVIPQAGLRERGYNGFIGQDATDVVKLMMAKMRDGIPYLKVDLTDCETYVDFEKRITTFFSDLVNDLRNSPQNDETLLFVSHGLCIQRLMVLLNSRPTDLGISNWTKNIFAERLIKNTNYHKLVLDIPRDAVNGGGIVGSVADAHFREHVNDEEKLRDTKNYTFLGISETSTHEEVIAHYCRPV